MPDEPGFAWREFLNLASELAARDDEASLRSSVSRAYYAVFHHARQALGQLDPEFVSARGYESHKAVWDALMALGARQAKNAARSGRSLLQERKHADYREQGGDWKHLCEQSIEQANRAIRSLDDLLT